MNSTWICQACRRQLSWPKRRLIISSARYVQSAAKPSSKQQLKRTRNIGIIAHIDAGKTTTTERMLYYSGFTKRIGNVDEGSTVTDFLPAERARGITIQSAAITFHWPPQAAKQAVGDGRSSHTVNLIDTPGHADFTFEVVRSLRILDGAVCILDGVAGVEAQTEKVWHQANGYSIPRLIYINKLDRDGASFNKTVGDIASRLHTFPALCQIPWWRKGEFIGVGDVVNLRALEWEKGGDGSKISAFNLSELAEHDSTFCEELKKARSALVETLAEHDEELVEAFLESEEDWLAIAPATIQKSLRNGLLTRRQAVTPVFAGASFRNIGVQPLLDAVNALLPSPEESVDPEVSLGTAKTSLARLLSGETSISAVPSSKSKAVLSEKDKKKATSIAVQNITACALAFKVVMDPRRGALVYLRVYQGSLRRGDLLYNTNLATSERSQKLLLMYASETVDIEQIDEGQIGVVAGLKHARTGDTLIVYSGANPKTGPPAPLKSLQLRPIAVPAPLFFTSIEPHSLSEEKALSDNLELLLREDPSLNVTIDAESGQTQLAGMGELHLEIARDRLLKDFKVKATMGKIEIGYRESVTEASLACVGVVDREIAGKSTKAMCEASVERLESEEEELVGNNGEEQIVLLGDSNMLLIRHPGLDTDGERTDELSSLPALLDLESIVKALQIGVMAALAQGPTYRFPLYSTLVRVTLDKNEHVDSTTTPAAISAAARQAVRDALRNSAKASSSLLEPVMLVDITVPEEALGRVLHDLNSARGGLVLSLDAAGENESGNDAELPTGSGSGLGYATVQRLSVSQLKRVYAPRDPFGSSAAPSNEHAALAAASTQRQIRARVPLKEMVGYLKHLRSLTGGRGTFTMSVDRYETMPAQRVRAALAEMRGDYS